VRVDDGTTYGVNRDGEAPQRDIRRKIGEVYPCREILAPGELSAEEMVVAAIRSYGSVLTETRGSLAAACDAAVAAETKRCAAVCRGLAASVPPQWRGAADACADAIEGKVNP
jgi:hypothetical protein